MGNVADQPHVVYVMYDVERRVIYVGMTGNLGKRLIVHQRERLWFRDVRCIDVEHYPSRDKAAFRESLLIKALSPEHNVNGAAYAVETYGSVPPARSRGGRRAHGK